MTALSIARPIQQRAVHLKFSPRPTTIQQTSAFLQLLRSRFGEVEHFKNLRYDSRLLPNTCLAIFRDQFGAAAVIDASPLTWHVELGGGVHGDGVVDCWFDGEEDDERARSRSMKANIAEQKGRRREAEVRMHDAVEEESREGSVVAATTQQSTRSSSAAATQASQDKARDGEDAQSAGPSLYSGFKEAMSTILSLKPRSRQVANDTSNPLQDSPTELLHPTTTATIAKTPSQPGRYSSPSSARPSTSPPSTTSSSRRPFTTTTSLSLNLPTSTSLPTPTFIPSRTPSSTSAPRSTWPRRSPLDPKPGTILTFTVTASSSTHRHEPEIARGIFHGRFGVDKKRAAVRDMLDNGGVPEAMRGVVDFNLRKEGRQWRKVVRERENLVRGWKPLALVREEARRERRGEEAARAVRDGGKDA